jgi:hypothetical protein
LRDEHLGVDDNRSGEVSTTSQRVVGFLEVFALI